MSTIHPSLPTQSFQTHYVTPPLTVILTIILLLFLFIGFFTLYFCKCLTAENTLLQPTAEPPPLNPGLDLKIINSFPTFVYSAVQDLREEKHGLECAICLLEFDEDHMIRLLTMCHHVFHQECIDLWFTSHTTCPVCRRDLDPPLLENTPNVEEIKIDVIQEARDDAKDYHDTTTTFDTWTSSSGQSSTSCVKKEEILPDKFSRSHSTGHSIVRNKRDEEDRFTLRLPEHVKIKITRGHNNHTGSCVTFAELNKGYDHLRFGEVSGQPAF